ncbi:MAG TPA: Gfo/Idh/MocA family oxidoreductase, partial [Chitinophagaceae bacterium]
MKNNIKNVTSPDVENENTSDNFVKSSHISRRKFVEMTAVSAIGFTILPRHVLGGKGYIPPSDKITLAYIGCGTQGTRELLHMLPNEGIHVVAVCDPNKNAIGYKDWSKNEIRDDIRNLIKDPNWNSGGDNMIPGGRDNGKSIVDSFYANIHPELKYKGCTAYADARELLDKEKNLDAVKIMTPDHLHGILCMAAIKKGKHVLVHKPISNRLLEGKKLIEMSRNSKVITHLIPWDSNGSMEQVMAWINAGAIGTLMEVHNWTNRPVWPQYSDLPKDTPSVPDGLDWNLWLGPEADRPYHPNYTN